MSAAIDNAKAVLREQSRARLRLVSPLERMAASALLCALLQRQPEWRQARTVLLFVPLANEPDVTQLVAAALAAGKTVALPQFDPESQGYAAARIQNPHFDLHPGQYGIPEPNGNCEPQPLNQLDFTLVPGLAFDWNGRRLGRGQGYYDRLLASVSGVTCGVAFDPQIITAVPVAPHDMRLNYMLTPTRWLKISDGRAVLK